MKIVEQIQSIFDKYELLPLNIPEGHKNIYCFLREYPELKGNFESEKDDVYFLKKYRQYISIGHYGFSIGEPIIPRWNEIIDEILELCTKTDPDFEIHQIKIKFGGIRFYCHSEIIEDLYDIERLVENTLHDSALIY